MPFIGQEPLTGAYHVLDSITASATATYNLQLNSGAFSPATANQLLVSLNGVIQKPGSSFTISGSQITFSSALTSSDSIDFIIALGDVLNVGTPTDGTVSTSKIANDAVTGAKIENNPTIAGNLTVSGNTAASGTLTSTGLITASAGVAIGGTGAANTLDDYEEGTWTATLGGSGGDPTVSSYSYNSGHYTKIGRQVYAHIYMRIEAGGISGGSGDGIIKGLPFAAKSDGQISNGVGGWIENYWSTSTSFSSGRNYPMLYLAAGSNYIGIWQKGTNNPTQMTAWALSQIDDAAFLVGGVLVYMTA